MHDAVTCEQQGVPAMVLVTNVFVDLARRTASNLGIDRYEPVVVPHPVFTRNEQWIEEQAAHAAGVIEGRLAERSR